MDDKTLDRVIDEVARQMVAGDVDGSFRGRVIERLGEPGVRRSPWLMAATAIAGALALAVVVYKHQPTGSPADARQAVAIGGPAVTGQPAPASRPPAGIDRPSTAIDPRTLAADTHSVAVDKRSAAGSTLAAPTTPADRSRDSAVAALAPARLDVASLTVPSLDRDESLQIPELEIIAPITVTPIGDSQGERP